VGSEPLLQRADLRSRVGEKALQQTNESLEIRVEKRTAELRKTNKLQNEITERKRAEQEAGESEERFRLLKKMKDYAIFMLDIWIRSQLECRRREQ